MDGLNNRMTDSTDLAMWKAEVQRYRKSGCLPALVMAIDELGLELIPMMSKLPCLQGQVNSVTRVIDLLGVSKLENIGKVSAEWEASQQHRVSRHFHTIMALVDMQDEVCLVVEFELLSKSKLETLSMVEESAWAGFGMLKCAMNLCPLSGRPNSKITFEKFFPCPGFVRDSGSNPYVDSVALFPFVPRKSSDGYEIKCFVKFEYWETPQLDWSLYTEQTRDFYLLWTMTHHQENLGHLTDVDAARLKQRISCYRGDQNSADEKLYSAFRSELKLPIKSPRAITKSIDVPSNLLARALAGIPSYSAQRDVVDLATKMIERAMIMKLGVVLSDPQPENPNQVSQLLQTVTYLTDGMNCNRITIGFEVKPKKDLKLLIDEHEYDEEIKFGIECSIILIKETNVFSYAYPEFVPLQSLDDANHPEYDVTYENPSESGLKVQRTFMLGCLPGGLAKATASR